MKKDEGHWVTSSVRRFSVTPCLCSSLLMFREPVFREGWVSFAHFCLTSTPGTVSRGGLQACEMPLASETDPNVLPARWEEKNTREEGDFLSEKAWAKAGPRETVTTLSACLPSLGTGLQLPLILKDDTCFSLCPSNSSIVNLSFGAGGRHQVRSGASLWIPPSLTLTSAFVS